MLSAMQIVRQPVFTSLEQINNTIAMYIFNKKFYSTEKCVPTKCNRCFKSCGQFPDLAGHASIVINLGIFRCKQDEFRACRG